MGNLSQHFNKIDLACSYCGAHMDDTALSKPIEWLWELLEQEPVNKIKIKPVPICYCGLRLTDMDRCLTKRQFNKILEEHTPKKTVEIHAMYYMRFVGNWSPFSPKTIKELLEKKYPISKKYNIFMVNGCVRINLN